MKKVQSAMYVISGGVYGVAYDIETLNEVLTELAKDKGEGAMKGARILNVLQDTYVDSFPMEFVEGELNFGDPSYSTAECTYVLPDYNDKEFEDLDDLHAFVKREIENGELTLDEAKALDIRYVEGSSTELNIEQFEGEWRMNMDTLAPKHTKTLDAMAIEYVSAEEADKRIRELENDNAMLSDIAVIEHEPAAMTDEEIAAELKKMGERMAALYKEQAQRKAQGIIV